MNEKALKKQAREAMLADYNSAGYGVNNGSREEAMYIKAYKAAIADVNAAIDAIFEELAEKEKKASNREFMELWGGAMALSDLRRSIDTLPKGLSGETEDFSDFDRSIDELKKIGNDDILKDAAKAHENSIPKNIRLHPRVSFALGAIGQKERMMEDTKMGHLDASGENGIDGMSYLKGWNDRWKSMENDAVVGYIRESEGTYWVESKPDEKIHGKVGDKVKLIIVKEDGV